MEKEEKGKLLLTFGPRENEILKEIPYLVKYGKFPDNKTEIFRRGFHVVRQLVEVNERPLLQILLERIERAVKDLDKNDLELITALSLVIYGTLIAKRGILGAEAFETIPLTCRQLIPIDRKGIDKTTVSQVLRALAYSVDTIFLKNTLNDSANKIMKIV